MEYKNCFVPSCKNDTVNSPDKLFVEIRQDLRKQWCEAVNTKYSKDFNLYTIYCCEDHFDPEKDLKDYSNYKKHKTASILKPTAKFRYITRPQSEISPAKEKSVSSTSDKVTEEPVSKDSQSSVLEHQPLLPVIERNRKILGDSIIRSKRITRAMNDLSKACRCCLLNVAPMKPIFDSSLDTMLMDIMGFQIKKNDGYPQLICTRCVRKLSAAYNFYQMVNQSHKTVQKKWKVPKGVRTKQSSADFASTEGEDKETHATTSVDVSCQTEEKFFQKLMLANVQLSRVKDDSYEIADGDYVMVCEEESSEKYILGMDENEMEELPDAKYICPQCLQVADSQEDLKKHMASHVMGAAEGGEDTTPAQLCNICGQTFKCRTSLYKHLRFHSGHIFQCKYCDKQFAEQSTLKVHLITHSLTNSKPFDCSLCERSFTQKAALKKHQRALHATERTLLGCEDCDKTFLYKLSLNKHTLRHHTPMRCNVCDEEFSGLKTLETHLKTHKKTKAFTYEAEYLEFDDL